MQRPKVGESWRFVKSVILSEGTTSVICILEATTATHLSMLCALYGQCCSCVRAMPPVCAGNAIDTCRAITKVHCLQLRIMVQCTGGQCRSGCILSSSWTVGCLDTSFVTTTFLLRGRLRQVELHRYNEAFGRLYSERPHYILASTFCPVNQR